MSILIQYDPYYIMSPDSLITATMTECNGDRLIFDPNSQTSYKQIISFASKLISLFVLIIWLIGSYSHKLIGVETLHTMHIIFITQVFAPRYRPVVIYFSDLHNSSNLFQSLVSSPEAISSSKYQRLSYSADLIYNLGFVVLL